MCNLDSTQKNDIVYKLSNLNLINTGSNKEMLLNVINKIKQLQDEIESDDYNVIINGDKPHCVMSNYNTISFLNDSWCVKSILDYKYHIQHFLTKDMYFYSLGILTSNKTLIRV